MKQDRNRELSKLQWQEKLPSKTTVIIVVSILAFAVYFSLVNYPVGEPYEVEGVLESVNVSHGGTGGSLSFYCILETGGGVYVTPAENVPSRLGERIVLIAQDRMLGGVRYTFARYESK